MHLLLLLLLALPGTAAAAPFGELPFRSTGGAAACLKPTGKPGEVVRWVRAGVEMLEARADGLHVTGRVDLGTYWSCPLVASDPSGAAVLAVELRDKDLEVVGLRVVTREPGSARWSAPVTIAAKRAWGVDVAVSARGDVAIAWFEYKSYTGDDYSSRLRAVRRAPGAGFGAVETLSPFREGFADGVEAGMSASGETVLAFVESELPGADDVRVRIAAPGAPFAAAQTLVTAGSASAPALAVAPDGRALVALRDQVFERAPGGAFAAGQPIDPGPGGGLPAVALRADGAAVLAFARGWQVPATVVTRSSPGAFGPPVVVAPARPWEDRSLPSAKAIAPLSDPPIERYPDVSVTLGVNGRALLVRPTDERDGRAQRGLQVVTFAGAGPAAAIERTTFGGTIRDAWGFSPVVLADGRFAVAWSDDRTWWEPGPRDGRLRVAVEGAAAAPEPAPPTVTVGTPGRRALRPAQSLLLPVRCSAACDVRVVARGAEVTGSLARAGTLRLRLKPFNRGLVPRRGRMRLTLHSSAPAARVVQRRAVRLAVRGLPAPPLPRILDVRTRRSGDDLLVRWRIDRPLVDASLIVIGSRVRRIDDDEDAIYVNARRVGGRSYQARLKDAGRVRHVRVYVSSRIPARERITHVPVPLS